MAYVIKEWFADETPDAEGVFVKIKGREGGLISFLLSWVGIDPTVTMIVDKENVRFEEGSWSGFFQRITPIDKLCTGGYGYSKPWKPALVMALIGIPLMIGPFRLGLLLIVGAVLYYFLNKRLMLEFSDIGGRTNGIAFQRSVIEGIKVDENEAARVIRILEALTQGKSPQREAIHPDTSPSGVRTVTASGHGAEPPKRGTMVSAPALFCPECGAKNTDSRAVCGSCGASLAQA